ncbi:hypothetical protein [Natrarchaeobaculum aegyptiacum]|uniref:Uncharacterized protein n=1 Tax=Natrarchaeobaculum aegyptiacum TaxID=745377 RepID=A0A2Z2HYC0_9EURY|nr:hypothetical protein [Natrarchaeobaculum aegyptiacum]ARS90747.1 hypothetical protein B1756_14115 [Natrarchaeobaculum aegyptiacum]
MQLEQRSRSVESTWSGSVPTAFDGRILGLVVILAGFAASLNVPYGGLQFAVVAFALLVAIGTVAHVLGERQLRRLTEGLLEHWLEAGAPIEDVQRSSTGLRTEWTVLTPSGEVTIGGLALVPIGRFAVEWNGVGDSVEASAATEHLDVLAGDLYEEIFEIEAGVQR